MGNQISITLLIWVAQSNQPNYLGDQIVVLISPAKPLRCRQQANSSIFLRRMTIPFAYQHNSRNSSPIGGNGTFISTCRWMSHDGPRSVRRPTMIFPPSLGPDPWSVADVRADMVRNSEPCLRWIELGRNTTVTRSRRDGDWENRWG